MSEKRVPPFVTRLTRRELLRGSAELGAVLMLSKPGLALSAPNTELLRLDFGGAGWTLTEEGAGKHYPASIPGSTYTNLLAAEAIPDPYYGENNSKVQWVAEKTWLFEHTFSVPRDLLAKRNVKLVCHGLDTLATLELNGHELGSANNMFRSWSFDVKQHIHDGVNRLRIRFDPLTPFVRERQSAYQQKFGINLPDERSWVRKAPYMWGWDWCRPVLTQGIWKKIEILGYDAHIADVGVFQNHQPDGSAQLQIHTTLDGQTSGTQVEAKITLAGEAIAAAKATVNGGQATLLATVAHPALWWPNGMGEQPLYNVTVQLKDAKGTVLDTLTRRIGLRTVEVVPPSEGEALQVHVNGTPVFAKGADWVPSDNMPMRVTPGSLRWFMSTAAACNFNFIRLWGGGYYEEDEMFDLCDELGIMLQFEFKFANASYPVMDKSWMSNLRAEVEQQTRRCRNHPSIVIWSGNNEIQFFKGYNELFGDVIGGIVKHLVPGAFYEVGSGAHGSGDIHSWGVWHGNEPVESYRKVEGFVTEFGMQSTPVPKTVRAFANAANRKSIYSPVMQYHELDGSGHGLKIIMDYVKENFGTPPKGFDDTLWLTDINQAWAINYGVEHWRRDMPRSMAAVIWQYNDSWPGSSWSMVDYYRRSKALLYRSRHFFAPMLVSGLPDAQSGQANIYITSDNQKDVLSDLHWDVTDLAGNILRNGAKQMTAPARTSRLAESLDLSDLIQTHGAQNLLIWPEVIVDGEAVARNTLSFGRPKELKLRKPDLETSISGGETLYHVTIQTDVPALWAWADLEGVDATYSDNFVDLRREHAAEIDITLSEPITPFEFQRLLKVRSVYDVAPEMRSA